MKYFDIALTIVFILALVGIYFFWGCQWDLYATILAGVVIFVNVLVSYSQSKKLKVLEETNSVKA